MVDKVKSIIGDYLGIKAEKINMDMDLIKDLNINSYDIMAIVGEFEEAFKIQVPDRDIRNFKNVQDIVNYMEKRL